MVTETSRPSGSYGDRRSDSDECGQKGVPGGPSRNGPVLNPPLCPNKGIGELCAVRKTRVMGGPGMFTGIVLGQACKTVHSI
jgi:hypothetical protein